VVLLIVYGAQLWTVAYHGLETVKEIFLLQPEDPFDWAPLLLSQFAHQGPWHLLANLGGLLAFGPLLERRLGSLSYTPLVLGVGILAGLAKVLVQAEPSWGASSFTLMLLSVWLVHGGLVVWGAHKIDGWPPSVARTLPWVLLAAVPVGDLYLFPRGGGTLAHVFSFLAALPVIAWLCHSGRPASSGGP
jgi:membrane associated rhomboid family serine protease